MTDVCIYYFYAATWEGMKKKTNGYSENAFVTSSEVRERKKKKLQLQMHGLPLIYTMKDCTT